MADDNTIEQDLADIEAAVRGLSADDSQLLHPPDDVWAGIAAALPELDDAPSPNVTPLTEVASSNVTSLSERRRRLVNTPRALLLAAAAVVLIVAGVAVIATTRGDDATVVATADLRFDPGVFDPLGADASAEVSLVEDGSRFEITLDKASLPDAAVDDADLEIWLIKPDAEGNVADLVSLGVVSSPDQTFAVPDGYDPSTYDVVDISVEPHDGNHDHSGRSILRGQLSA